MATESVSSLQRENVVLAPFLNMIFEIKSILLQYAYTSSSAWIVISQTH